MRLPVLAAVSGVLLGAACTNDYDALLDGASGGGSAASSAESGATTTDAASSAASTTNATTAATTDAASSSSSASSGGGDGGAGDGGAGGAGDGGAGDGGRGGGDPGVEPCPIQLDLTELPDGWGESVDGATITIGSGTLRVELDGGGGGRYGLVARGLAGADELRDCSLTSSVESLADIPNTSRVNGSLIALGEGGIVAAIDVSRVDPSPGGPFLEARVVVDTGSGLDELDAPLLLEDEPPTSFRMRDDGGMLVFDVFAEGAWAEVGRIDREELAVEITRVGLGASISGNDGSSKVVTLGPINVP